MKSLSKHLQESLNEESKSIVDIAVGDGKSKLRLSESNPEETNEEVANEEVTNEDAKNEDVVTEEATEKEKPSE